MSSYRNHYDAVPTDHGQIRIVCTHDWRDHTHQRLEWLYGPERAYAILNGQDAKTNADLASWNALGERRAA